MTLIRAKNVVLLHNATKTQTSFYLAMELCNGGDLQNYLNCRGGYLQEKEARIILCQIIEGLKAMREQNIIHRDLKLPNILVNFDELKPDLCNDPDFSKEVFENYV